MAGIISFVVGAILLAIGIIGGFGADQQKHGFSVWLTIAGIGFVITAIILMVQHL
jgi:glucose dehydrogenase